MNRGYTNAYITSQYPRDGIDAVPPNPHFTFHSTLRVGPMNKSYDPSYGVFENEVSLIKAVNSAGVCLTGTAANAALRNNQEQKYATLGWKSGEEIVSSNTYELASRQEAEEMLRKTLNAPMSVPLQITKLTQLGDEAYMSTGPYSNGKTNLLVRKGNYFILMSATSQGLAKRFAKHMVAEIDN